MTTQNDTTGLDHNIASMMCYILFPLTGIAFLVVEKKDQRVRFHAWQSIFLFGGLVVSVLALWILEAILGALAGFLGAIVGFLVKLVFLGGFALWVVSVVKSYQGETWKIPVIGEMAEKQMRL